MLRRLPGESDLGFFGSSDSGDAVSNTPYDSNENVAVPSNPPETAQYNPGYRDTYASAASVPLSPWCILYYVILPCFALFGLVVAIYYWRCCPWLCCYRNDDDYVWRDQSTKARGDSDKTEGTAENTPPNKSNGVPTSIAIAIPEGSVQPQQQQIQRETLPPVAKEVSSGRSWIRSKKDANPPPLKKGGILHDHNLDVA